MASPNVTREDLAAHFHLPISDAARRLNICTTVMKKICRQHGIARWPQRKVAALRKRIKALEYELAMSAAPDKKAGITEQLRFLGDELAAILDGTAPCLSNPDEMDSEPTSSSSPNTSQNRKRKHGFEGPTLKLDRMEIETDESGQDLSPATSFTPRNPFPQNSPRYRLENNRHGLPSPHSRDDSSEFVEESPRSDLSSLETTPRQTLPSLPQDDAMAMLLEAITSVETEAPSKRMRFGNEGASVPSLPPLASLRSAMNLDTPRNSFSATNGSEIPFAAYPFYDYTPRPSQPTPQSAYPTLFAPLVHPSSSNGFYGFATSVQPQPQFRF